VAGGYVVFNTSLSWTDADEHLTLTAWANNLSDERYRLTFSGNSLGTYTMWSEPRTYGVKAEYKF
jgi:iron complex outermembrane receptor protein